MSDRDYPTEGLPPGKLHDGDVNATEAPTLAAEPPSSDRIEQTELKNVVHKLANVSRFDDCGTIGIGGMGKVHVVYDQVLLRRVAMKSLRPDLAESAEHTQRFLEEVQITGQLDHPNIVPVHDIGLHEQGNAFFVMKLVNGETLGKMLFRHANQQLTGRRLEKYLRIFLKVCDALEFAHSRNVIHRDLKPSNIMVGRHGEVYVMDWGIALMLGDARQHTPGPMLPSTGSSEITRESAGSQLGTPAYMSPEQAHGRVDDFDVRTDVFGLGGILYEILTGLPPYPGENPSSQLAMARQALVCPPARATPARRLPPALCRIAMKALAKDRDSRYQTVAELREDVEAFLRCGGWFESLSFSPGTIIVEEGDEGDEAYIIEKGNCEVYKIRSGRRHVLRSMGPGDVFGETAIFTGKPRSASVVAVDEVRVIAISREALDYELAERGWLANFVTALAERFREFDAKLTRLESDDD